ncbi:MAG: hypothetical protein WD342_10210 [Verrucomicrobiales bacterium]
MAAFCVWAFGGRFFESEKTMYAGCAAVFLGLGGLALTPGSGLKEKGAVPRFCLAFAVAFVVYSLIWSVAWFTFRNTFGEIVGSFAGLLGLVAVVRAWMKFTFPLLTATAVVFLWHTLGYYTGGFLYDSIQGRGAVGFDFIASEPFAPLAAKLAWGLFYGLGLGLGLGSLLQMSRQTLRSPS